MDKQIQYHLGRMQFWKKIYHFAVLGVWFNLVVWVFGWLANNDTTQLAASAGSILSTVLWPLAIYRNNKNGEKVLQLATKLK